MAVDKSYERLGVFLLVTLVVVVGTALFFIYRMNQRAAIEMVTYSDGNVSGLDIGSPVRFRGVNVGSISDLRIEPRGSLVEIDFDVLVDRLTGLGANVARVRQETASGLVERLRAQVVSNPVTGEAYLLIDMPQAPPPGMALAFTPTRAYVPAMSNLMETMNDRLPALMELASRMFETIEKIANEVPDSIKRTDAFFAVIERIIRDANLPAMAADTRKFFSMSGSEVERMSSNIERITADLDKALGPNGTLETFVEDMNGAIAAANLEATTQATREAMNQSSLAADDLRRSLPAIRDALAQLRDLARLLEEQPESMVYGPRPATAKK
jgi:phospholipid/cholesterol/gamma-HCH transport system substrate-binding protein